MPTATQTTTNSTPNSRVPVQVDVRSSLNFDAMWKAHPMNWSPPEETPWRKPVQKSDNPFAAITEGLPVYENQCAIKMSFALEAGGLLLNTYPKGRMEVRPVERLNNKKMRGALAAEELYEWLVKAIGKPEILDSKEALSKVKGRKGIVFFKDFWIRPGETSPQGDHIDLWNGIHLPGQAPGTPTYTGTIGFFTRSKSVMFWELK